MKKCPSCNTPNDNDSAFCRKCGTKLLSKNTCPSCGKEISSEDTFCNYCGENLRRSEKTKPKKMKLSRLKKTLIVLGSFFGFLALLYLATFIYMRFFFLKQHTPVYNIEGNIEFIQNKAIPELFFEELTICKDIDQNTFAPVEEKDKFYQNAEEVFATIYVSGAGPEDTFQFVWKYGDTGETIFDFSYDYFLEGSFYEGYIYSFLAIPPEVKMPGQVLFDETGNYEVEFYHNGQLIDEASFLVDKAPLTFGELVVGENIDSSSLAPVGPATEYSFEVAELYSVIYISGSAEQEDNFRFTLKNNQKGDIIKEYTGSYYDLWESQYTEDYLYFYLLGPLSDGEVNLTAGNYTVGFYHNGKLESESQFTINEPELSFGELVTSKDVEKDSSPIDEADKFILGAKRICTSIKVDGADSDDRWRFIFLDSDKNILAEYEDQYYVGEGEYYYGYRSINPYVPDDMAIEGIQIFGFPGTYYVEYYHNNELIDTRQFEIIDEGISFGEVVAAADLDSDDSPIGVKEEFEYGIELMFFTIKVSGASIDDRLSFVLKDKENGIIVKEYDFLYSDNWDKGGDTYNGYFGLGINLPDDMELEEHYLFGNPGSYLIQYYHDGYFIDGYSFKIIE